MHSKYAYFYFINNHIQYKPNLVDLDEAIICITDFPNTHKTENFHYCCLRPSAILTSDFFRQHSLIIIEK